jgi:hypothetical protein
VIRPNRDQRAQFHTRTAISIPHTNGDSIAIVLHTQLEASLGTPGSFRCIDDVEDVCDTSHEGDGARSRVKVTDLALEIIDFGQPWLNSCWHQCLFNLFGSEAVANGGARSLFCDWGGRWGGRSEEILNGAVLMEARHDDAPLRSAFYGHVR